MMISNYASQDASQKPPRPKNEIFRVGRSYEKSSLLWLLESLEVWENGQEKTTFPKVGGLVNN